MPWHISKGHSGCPPSKPYAVVKDSDDSVEGCHPTRAKADAHMRALYANEPKASSDMTEVLDDVQAGGKPNPGTGPDKRLGDNGTPCPKGQSRDADGNCVEYTAEVEALAWDGSAGRFTDEQYRRAAAACGTGSTPKQDCILPHHDPGGALNADGVHAAARRIGQVKAAPATIAAAKRHLRGHYRTLGEQPPDSLKASADELAAFAADLAGQPTPVETRRNEWEGVLLVEGVKTGDRRQFAEGAIEWPNPDEVPIALQWQKSTGHGSDNEEVVNVGRIREVWRDGNKIMGRGPFDSHPDAVEAKRRLTEGFAGGVSILGDNITDADVELVFPKAEGQDEDDDLGILQMMFAEPELVIFHKARLRGATMVDVPAFVEAVLHIIPDDQQAEPSPVPIAASASASASVAVHESPVSDSRWGADVHEARVPAEMAPELAELLYAHVLRDEGHAARSGCRFLHHEMLSNGAPGPANIHACRAALDALPGASIPDADKRGVYEHLAAHLLTAGITPAPYQPAAVVAAAWSEGQFRRHKEWFQDPHIIAPTPIMVTDAGQVFGLATEWNKCHIGIHGECVLPPKEAYHAYYLTGSVPAEDGSQIPVGQITAGIGHANTSLPWQRAAEHYDNTAAVVADVTTGNCRHGIWVAGQVRPHADPARVDALRATGQVSPDWRPIGGALRLVGMLAVNTSGFQVPKVRVGYDSHGEISAMIASGMVSVHPPAPSSEDYDRRALELMRNSLRKRVYE